MGLTTVERNVQGIPTWTNLEAVARFIEPGLIGAVSGNLASMTERYGVSRTSGPLLDTSSPTQSVPDWYSVLASILTGIVYGCECAGEGCALISRHKAAPTAV
jgi:hypothetical protein